MRLMPFVFPFSQEWLSTVISVGDTQTKIDDFDGVIKGLTISASTFPFTQCRTGIRSTNFIKPPNKLSHKIN